MSHATSSAAKPLTLSLVIPVYNEESYLKACLDAVAKQSQLFDHVYVVNNNSTDRSVEIAQSYDFVTVLHERKKGVAYARDKGFDTVKSDIICRIDADTVIHAGWARSIINFFETHPEVAAMTGPVGYHDMPIKQVGLTVDRTIRQLMYSSNREGFVFLFGSNMAIRRTAWRAVKKDLCYSSMIHEDVDLAIHLLEDNRTVVLDQQMIASVSSRREEDSPRDFWRYQKMNLYTCSSHGLRRPGVVIGVGIYMTTYPILKLLRRAYDPHARKLSVAKFIRNRTDPRALPMGR